jgi:hypothetical protein
MRPYFGENPKDGKFPHLLIQLNKALDVPLFRRRQPLDWFPRRPHFQHVGWALYEWPFAQCRANDPGRHVEVVILRVHLAGIIFKASRISRFRSEFGCMNGVKRLRTCERREEFQACFSRDCTWFRRSKGLHLGDRRLKVTRTELGPSGIEEPVNAYAERRLVAQMTRPSWRW